MATLMKHRWISWVLLIALAVAGFIAPDSVEAKRKRDLKNSVTITLSSASGDANATAYCLNVVKKHEQPPAADQECLQTVEAGSGGVSLKGLKIYVVQKADDDGNISSAPGTVDLTITARSGDADAIAKCLNLATDNQDVVDQTCKQKVEARSGNVKIKGVKIYIVQNNDAERDAQGNLNNTVTINITAESGDANALAYCLNLAKDNEEDVKQRCKQKVKARSGNATIKNVKIFVVQPNAIKGDVSDALDSVDVTITAISGDVNTLAYCLNQAKDNADTVDQVCNQYVDARSGKVTVKNIKVIAVQDNDNA
jgi:hypothetical protein